METVEELTQFLAEATREGIRGRLQARGEARAIIRRNGVLPQDAPAFAETIDTDLTEYGFSLLRASLALREIGGNANTWRRGFVAAGNAFEALVRNGPPDAVDRGFLRVIGAASYHLGSYSALAFSMISDRPPDANFAPAEEALVWLLLRDLNQLAARTKAWLIEPTHSDEHITQAAAAGELDPDDVVTHVVTTTIFRAFAFFEFALQTGSEDLVDEVRRLLRGALSLASRANAVPLWWITRVSLNLIDDLWTSSLHRVLPIDGPGNSYRELRRLFIGQLYSRKAAEIELWPSQLGAAQRAVDIADDLVVALPTSAGKTRIAEIAALTTLSAGTRVLIVTPLRALSAQTERSFRRTFSSLGFSVSSLYGASGIAAGDEDALRSQNIVITTPEKLDFALRNDSTIIDDIGLVVLDEGHLIGPSEREIRYENLVQRLLRRVDSANRRIVCLSAILPAGDQLDDLTAWIRNDAPGAPIQSRWRPTRQRFGTLTWLGTSARLSFDLEAGGPFIRDFVSQTAPIRPRRTPFPRDNKELTLAAAWKFAEQSKRALVFCTQRDHVEGFAEAIIDLHQRGFLRSLLQEQELIQRAVAVGTEWLGATHPAVLCLPIGVAIHHARLPGAFLREVESLLAAGVLSVTVASPTLAQGLNLNAAVLLIPSLYRSGNLLSNEEFANVAGRAGRAFVDLEGLVLYVMHDPQHWRFEIWRELVNSARARSLRSGIITVVAEVMSRLARAGVFRRADAMEYLANSQEAWFPQDQPDDTESIESLIERLDATVLGLIEALDANSADLPQLLDDALAGSLWSRQLARLDEEHRRHQLWVLEARARLIWNKSDAGQRRSQFAMGVGLEAGLAIDALAAELTEMLAQADGAAVEGDPQRLADNLIGLAERLFLIRPFVPDVELPLGWRDLLRAWVSGADVDTLGLDNLRIVEDAFVYRLVWAIEAIRMRRRARGEESEIIEGGAAAALETGLPNIMMAMLVRAGLPSRVAAMRVIIETQPVFANLTGMNLWLRSDEMAAWTDLPDWPTPETSEIWREFRSHALASSVQKWSAQEWAMDVDLPGWVNAGIPHRIDIEPQTQDVSITTPDYRHITGIRHHLRQYAPSLLEVRFAVDRTNARIVREGRGEARWELP